MTERVAPEATVVMAANAVSSAVAASIDAVPAPMEIALAVLNVISQDCCIGSGDIDSAVVGQITQVTVYIVGDRRVAPVATVVMAANAASSAVAASIDAVPAPMEIALAVLNASSARTAELAVVTLTFYRCGQVTQVTVYIVGDREGCTRSNGGDGSKCGFIGCCYD